MEATQGQGVIHIDASCTDETWRLEISDTGDGIPQNVMDKIFEPFFTTRSKGTGLGLAYTAQVISAHRGKITAANKPGGGGVFRIEIPREPEN
jgi:signal transduction histidine kinase